jgi:FkbM family methyltransferase
VKKLFQIINYIRKHPLAERHPFLAFYRFFYWQISQFVFPSTWTVTFIGHTKILLKKGLTGATGNYYTGLHEFYDMSFLLHFLRKEDWFADVGANVGSYTILASGHVQAKTIAFEPVPSTFHWLSKNIEINKINKLVYAYNNGIGSKDDILFFTKNYDTVNHVVMNQENSDLTAVNVYSLQHFTRLHSTPILIKIDVEGFETEVLNGMNRLLDDNDLKAIIIELNGSGRRYGYDEKLIHSKLLSAGFCPVNYDPFNRQIKFQHELGLYNTIYIRDIDFVVQRLKTSSNIEIFNEAF